MKNTNDIFSNPTFEDLIPDLQGTPSESREEHHLRKWFAGLRGDIEMQTDKIPTQKTLDLMPSNILFQASDAALRGGDMETRTALLHEARKRDDDWGKMADITLKIEELHDLVETAKESR